MRKILPEATCVESGTVSDAPSAAGGNPISPEAVESAVDAALAAIAAATSTAELKGARSAHAGEASPLAKLNSLLRQVPGPEKAATGKLVGGARGRVTAATAAGGAGRPGGEPAARLASERVDVTAASTRWQPG